MSNRLRIALTKGRLQDNSVALFERAGLDCSPIKDPGRRLVHSIPNYPLDAVLSKAPDVITYVEHGICDLGIVGKDTIMEQGGSFFEVLDLGFGKCRFALAVKEGSDFYGTYKTRTIASKYPAVTKAFFAAKGMDVDVIKIEGSVAHLGAGGCHCGHRGDRRHVEGQRPGAYRDGGAHQRPTHREYGQHEAVQKRDFGLYQ